MSFVLRSARDLLALSIILCALTPVLVRAATPAQIDATRANALAWLYLNQDGDGLWNGPGKTDIQATASAMRAFAASGISTGYSRGAALTWLSNSHALSV
jgi:hypothetical protein